MLEIIDAHQHFWDIEANYHPWLCDPEPIPFRYGSYAPLRRNYLPEHYRNDTQRFNVVGSVAIEAEWDTATPRDEINWLQQIDDDLPTATVAQARLNAPNIRDLLEDYAAMPIVKGIRHKPKSVPAPADFIPEQKGGMDDPAWRAGFALLAPLGLSFDLQVPWWHLAQARRLADDYPNTQIILNHTGLPSDRHPKAIKQWERAMKLLAGAGNVAVKISGLGRPGCKWTIEDNAPIVFQTIEIFGHDRCMFASNFPVDSLIGSFDTIFGGFIKMTENMPSKARAKLFAENARRIYRLS